MKLYFSPGACSLASHIVATEGKVPVSLSKVTFSAESRTTAEGENFFEVNPKGGYVPALKLDSGEVLTEGVAIMQYLADQSKEGLMPAQGSMEYYRALEWLTFINSELHKQFSPLYQPDLPESQQEVQKARIQSRMKYPEEVLGNKQYLLGDTFTLPDAYFYTIMRWTKRFSMSLDAFPHIASFMTRMDERLGVQQALSEEGIEAFSAS